MEYAERHSERSANLTDEDRKLASLPIEVFGEPLVSSTYHLHYAELLYFSRVADWRGGAVQFCWWIWPL